MLVNKRAIKKRENRKKVVYLIAILVFILIVGLGIAVLWAFSLKNSSVVSPLPFTIGSKPNIHPGKDSDESSVRDALSKKAVQYDTIATASDSAYIVTLKTGEEILLSPAKNMDEQISSLQLILSRLTMEGRSFRKLDLRFEKPMITFK